MHSRNKAKFLVLETVIYKKQLGNPNSALLLYIYHYPSLKCQCITEIKLNSLSLEEIRRTITNISRYETISYQILYLYNPKPSISIIREKLPERTPDQQASHLLRYTHNRTIKLVPICISRNAKCVHSGN